MTSRLSQLSLLVLIIATILWLGGINIRAMAGSALLTPWTLDFKPNIHPYVERAVFGIISKSSMVVNIAYLIVWISAFIFLRASDLKFKEHGWLMMSAILFYLFTPVELYTIVLDARMWHLDYIGSNDLVEFRKLFIHRLAALKGVPMIGLLSYYTIIGLVIFRPFHRIQSQKANEIPT